MDVDVGVRSQCQVLTSGLEASWSFGSTVLNAVLQDTSARGPQAGRVDVEFLLTHCMRVYRRCAPAMPRPIACPEF